MLVIGWRLGQRSMDHHRFDGATDELYLPLWPFSLFMAVLCVVNAVLLFAMFMWPHTAAEHKEQAENTSPGASAA
ncbi:MAG: hypothetical protein WBD51_00545, partial [Burkholderiaceae bacterium]